MPRQRLDRVFVIGDVFLDKPREGGDRRRRRAPPSASRQPRSLVVHGGEQRGSNVAARTNA
jgi:hypothetical protein